MRLVFNLKYFRAGRIGGQESVIRQLTAGLATTPLGPDQRMFAVCTAAERESVAGMCAWSDLEIVESDAGERRMGRALRRLRPDLYFCPMLVVEPADPPCPTVVGIPDLQHETYPEFFTPEVLANRRRSYGQAVHRADLILTISEYARGTILARYPEFPPERILVAHLGVEPQFENPAAAAEDLFGLEIPDDFLLFPANFWPHKNHSMLLESLAALRASGLAPPLVLTGDPGSGFERVEAEIRRLELEDQVRFLGRLPPEKFVSLMRSARALVFPSLYEGFGLPILEAFHCETPVVCSNVTSCPEVAGDAALLVDPTSVEEIANAIRRIWLDDELRSRLVERGCRRRLDFRWSASLAAARPALLELACQPQRRPSALSRLLRTIGVGSLTA